MRGHELILLIGPPDSGKSMSIIHIAEVVKPVKGKVIDTENGVAQLWGRVYRHLDNLEIVNCRTIEDVLQAFEQFRREVKPQDWFVIDSVARIWEMAQDKTHDILLSLMSANCNVIATTLLAPDLGADIHKRQVAQRLGLSVLWEGGPRLPFYFDTVIVTSKLGNRFHATVTKDRDLKPRMVAGEVRQFWQQFLGSREAMEGGSSIPSL